MFWTIICIAWVIVLGLLAWMLYTHTYTNAVTETVPLDELMEDTND